MIKRQSIHTLCRNFLYKNKKSESITDNGEFRIFIFWWRKREKLEYIHCLRIYVSCKLPIILIQANLDDTKK